MSRCRICHCTWEDACPGGCGWVREKAAEVRRLGGPICTTCADFRSRMALYLECARRVSNASLGRLRREVEG